MSETGYKTYIVYIQYICLTLKECVHCPNHFKMTPNCLHKILLLKHL